MTQLYQIIQARLYTFLTRERDRTALRRLQFTCLGITLVLVTAVLSYSNLGHRVDFNEEGNWEQNSNAPATVVAVRDIEFSDEVRLEEARNHALLNTPLHFSRDFSMPLVDSAAEEKPEDGQPDDPKKIRNFPDLLKRNMDALTVCRQAHQPGPAFRACVQGQISDWPALGQIELEILQSRSLETINENLKKLVNLLYRENVILDDLPAEESSSDQIIVTSYNLGSDPQATMYAKDTILLKKNLRGGAARERFNSQATVQLKTLSPELRPVLVEIAVGYLARLQGADYSESETEKARQAALGKIEPTKFMEKYKRGDAIVKKGEPLTPLKFRALQEHNQAKIRDAFSRTLAIFFQQIVFLFLLVYFLRRHARFYLGKVKSNLIFFITLWAFIILLLVQRSFWSDRSDYNELAHFFGAWVPIGLFVVLFSLMFRESVAVPIAVYMALLVFVASQYDGNSLVITLVIGILSAIMGRKIQRRTHFISTAILLACMKVMLVVMGYFYTDRDMLSMEAGFFAANFLDAMQVSLFSGLASMFVILILPVYEAIFNQPTRFKLAELADPSHPLLQELFQRAPSTWTHTLMVAALSEKACERLGLDTLLCRTGVYYHDIGKMKNAGFFAENQHLIPKPENIDRDNPQMAAKVIIDHVLDGIVMAREARLPEEIIAFIPEHHGTSTMAFFYHKALERSRRKVNRADFRYPGPRPRSRETGIVMIADSLEAASRSLERFDEESVTALIQRIINMKLAENQLDESGLTMGDLTVVREALRDVLLSSFQYRPSYPTTEKTRELEAARGNGRGGPARVKAASAGRAASRKSKGGTKSRRPGGR